MVILICATLHLVSQADAGVRAHVRIAGAEINLADSAIYLAFGRDNIVSGGVKNGRSKWIC